MTDRSHTPKSRFPWPIALVGFAAVAGLLLARPGTQNEVPVVAVPSATPSPSPTPEIKGPTTRHPGYDEELPAGGIYEDGAITHTVQPGEYLETIAARYLKFTDYYTRPELTQALKDVNQLGRNWVNPNETLTIPGARKLPPQAQVVPRPKDFTAKGVYITNTSAASTRVFSIIKQLKPYGLNTIVFDAKDMSGIIGYASQVPEVRAMNADKEGLIRDMPKFIEKCHQEGIHVVARVTQFYDQWAVKHHPDWSIKFKQGGLFHDGRGVPTWVDPSLKEVQDYNIAILKELASMGVDELQLDYIRFPAEGRTHDAVYRFDPEQTPKYQVIADYLERAREALKPYQALLSVDVYGTVAWDQPIDVRITGQRLDEMAKHVDIISSMLYPSHFYGNFDNLDYPPDHPYYFYEKGVRKVYNKTAVHQTTNRPWVQAFPYRIRNYGPDYIRQQLQGSYDAGGNGWLMWNSNNNYDMVARALDGWQEKETPKRLQALARISQMASGQMSDASAQPAASGR